ncbi:unnamed protein product [Peronospora belbahrii]|uniref:Temptin Cys/Cys disulfide domain-containing protein n=1 Tax=Peronospora belbahrii TaxID=622444 RepID=A0ABN8CSM0_9STRA|nr:unnamed protein product [Peronospora belbahrii]
MSLRFVIAMVILGLMVTPFTIDGYPKYVELIPNGGDVPDVPNIGHLDPAGETGLSTFGEAFSKTNNVWTVAVCQQDTDGDGYTNGQELGDPCCTWTESNKVGLITDGVSDPSDVSKIPTNSELLAGCTSFGGDTSSGDMAGVVGTVAPGDPTMGGMPPDDDEDDSSESAMLTNGFSGISVLSKVVMGMAVIVAIAVAW